MADTAVGAVELAYEDGEYAGASLLGPDGESLGTVLVGADPRQDIDTFFLIVSAALVFFMQCGFAMLSVGSVRSKNAKNIILKNLLDACFGAVCFYLVGYAFAYGGDFEGGPSKGNNFIGWEGFALNSVPKTSYAGFFFQYAFAATAATIVSGAVAERCKFGGYLLYASLLTTWVYPVVVHWVWSGTGWASAFRGDGDLLFGTGVIDFAGCAVVHMVGGLAAFAGALVIGPRIGRFDADGKPATMEGHNASLAILGVFILWFGWYGFNPGSALLIIDSGTIAALAAVNTTLSAASATVSSMMTLMVIEYISTGHVMWDLIGSSNGTLAGLVGITAACSVVEPWAAIIIGITSGMLYVAASYFMLNILKIDDPLDACAVHLFCGAWGVIMPAVFAHRDNVAAAYPAIAEAGHFGFVMSGGDGRLLGCALVVILAVSAWVLGHMIPFFFVINKLGMLRVDETEERLGLDVSHHGGAAYDNLPPHGDDWKAGVKPENATTEYATLLARVETLERQQAAPKAI